MRKRITNNDIIINNFICVAIKFCIGVVLSDPYSYIQIIHQCIIHFCIILYRAEKRYQKRDAEIHHKAVEEGNDDKVLSGGAGDDGEGSIHGGGTA